MVQHPRAQHPGVLPLPPVQQKPGGRPPQAEVLLVSHRGMMVPLQAETGGWGEVAKSVRDLGCCSLQGAFEMQVGVEGGRVCPKVWVGIEGRGFG